MVIMCLFTTFLTSPVIELIFPAHIRASYEVVADKAEASTALSANKKHDHNDEDGEPQAATMSNDSSLTLKSFDYNARLSVIVDRNEHVEDLLRFVNMFAPVKDENRLSVAAIRVVEPSNTYKDKTLMLNSKGENNVECIMLM